MTQPTIQNMLSEFLGALGFAQMAEDVKSEQDRARLSHYARIVLRQLPEDRKRAVATRFYQLRLI